jgi:hypothetical protein
MKMNIDLETVTYIKCETVPKVLSQEYEFIFYPHSFMKFSIKLEDFYDMIWGKNREKNGWLSIEGSQYFVRESSVNAIMCDDFEKIRVYTEHVQFEFETDCAYCEISSIRIKNFKEFKIKGKLAILTDPKTAAVLRKGKELEIKSTNFSFCVKDLDGAIYDKLTDDSNWC